ncbi:flagellar basal body P-ring formation chaperone FlgA [Vibrio sp. DNB22_10_4]
MSNYRLSMLLMVLSVLAVLSLGSAHAETTEQELTQRITAKIATVMDSRYPHPHELEVKMRFSKALKHVAPCPIEPRISVNKQITLGTVKWFVRCPTLGWKLSATSTSSLTIHVATAGRAMKKGYRLQPEDIRFAKVTLKKAESVFFDATHLIGSKLRRTVRVGDVLTAKRFYLDYDVEKGLPVNLIYHSNTFSLETDGVALEDGLVGDTIAIRNAQSGKTLKGVIVEKNLVRVF